MLEAAGHPDIASPVLYRQIKESDIDRRISTEEDQMSVRSRPLRAVRVQVDLRQRMHEAPNASPEDVTEGLRNDPGQGRMVAGLERMRAGVVSQ